jgi:hypothetical protein
MTARPAGQDAEMLIAARDGYSTAPFALECSSFLDNLPAGCGAKGSVNTLSDEPVPASVHRRLARFAPSPAPVSNARFTRSRRNAPRRATSMSDIGVIGSILGLARFLSRDLALLRLNRLYDHLLCGSAAVGG